MGLTISSVLTRLFGKKQMRILMGEVKDKYEYRLIRTKQPDDMSVIFVWCCGPHQTAIYSIVFLQTSGTAQCIHNLAIACF